MNDTTLRWHCLGLSALGFLVGYFVALSESPVVGTLLPLLFGVIAGISGFVLGKTNLKSAEGLKRLKFWGIGFFAFSISIFLSSLLGLFAKNTVSSFREASIDVSGLDARTAADIIGLRRRLQILGASRAEQAQIIESAKQQALSARSAAENVKELLSRFLPAENKLISALDNSLSSGAKWSDDTSKLIANLSAVTKSTVPVLTEWSTIQKTAVDIEGIHLILSTTDDVASQLLGVSSRLETKQLLEVSKDPKLLAALFQVKALLGSPLNQALAESNGMTSYSNVDKLTELLLSGKATQDNLTKLFANRSNSYQELRDGV